MNVLVMGVSQSADDLVAVVDDLKTDGSARSETIPRHWVSASFTTMA